jgi:sodium/potassium-transporting ATPase subunit alpha
MDQIASEKGGKSKPKDKHMGETLKANEGIRGWRFQMMEGAELEKELKTMIFQREGEIEYHGLTATEAHDRLV